jgi:hypothetical protein
MKPNKKSESGFAVLMVFLLAAVISIGLYYEMPRVAFESQRAREQMLVDRGLQYRRAIQLFYRKFGRYPASMDDLETTNNIRFLRHKYKDPMTGKDDWRIVHIGPGGVLTDSLVQKAQNPLAPDKDKDKQASSSNTVSNPGSTTGNGTPTPADDQTQGLNLATVRRPSDQMAGGPPGGTGQQPGQIGNPNDPNPPVQQLPPQATLPPGQTIVGQPQNPDQPLPPGQPAPQPVNPNAPYDPNNPNPNPNNPNPNPNPPQPYDPNAPQQVQQPPPGFIQGRGGFVPQSPGFPGAPMPPQAQQPGAPNQAVNVIQNLLTTPRQPPASLSTSSSGGGGTAIAGVASKYEGSGIKIINDHKKYKEWEFVYDFKNDTGRQGAVPGLQQQPAQQPGSPTTPGTAPVTPATGGTPGSNH